jgi:hypothetical protein
MKGDLRCRRRKAGSGSLGLGSMLRAMSLVAVGAILLALGGCDGDPSGEGDWTVGIQGPGEPYGAAVVMVSGEGVLELRAGQGTQVWSREVGENTFRAVVIQDDDGGSASFRIRVRDVGGAAPAITLLELADKDDEPVPVSGEHRLRLRR